jgi:hypothetical protein
MLMIRSEKIRVITTGIAGSATGESNSSPFQGRILSVQLVPNASLPATADTTVFITKDGDENTNVETVATFTNTNSLTKRYPMKESDDGAGSSLAAANKTNVFVPFVTTKGVHVEVAQADALNPAVEVEVTFEG